MTVSTGSRFGPYEIIEKIGSGGMGDVYRARDSRLDREVAIKLVSQAYLGSDGTPSPGSRSPRSPGSTSHERFLREARSSSALNHPNICTIYDVGEQDGVPYLVMELLQGETLKAFLASHTVSPSELLQFARQTASALTAAHAKGIIHRDIKPANLFVVPGHDGTLQIKILDFGLAKRQGEASMLDSQTSDGTRQSATAADENTLTTPGSTIGTISYMSPEQAKGQRVDARTDLFSLGSVLYEVATRRSPFAGDSTAEIFAALLMREPVPPSSLNPVLPPAWDNILAGLLAKEPSQRTQSAAALGAALRSTFDEKPSSGDSARFTAPPPAVPPTPSANPAVIHATPARSRTGLYAVLALLLAALIGGGYFFWSRHQSKPATLITEKDSIILSDFTNTTGDPVFDTTLKEALAIQLEQSPFLNIVSEQHLRQSMKYLGRSPDDRLTPAIAREIGEREGYKAILTGTIASLGSQYIVTLEAQSTANGDSIAREQAPANDKEHVLEALDKVATAMRARLGESLSSIQALNTPYGQATTTSLDAFRAYALGDVEHLKGNDLPIAAGYYQRAIDIDPKFAMAYARLGIIYSNAGAIAKSNTYIQKAYELSSNLSEREKLYITAHYQQNIVGDLPRTIETWQLYVNTYPREFAAITNLGAAYSRVGQMEKSNEYFERAVAIRPENAVATLDLGQGYFVVDRYQDAERIFAQGVAHGLGDDGQYHATHLQLDFVTGNLGDMQRHIDWAQGKPDGFEVIVALAQVEDFRGRYKAAATQWQHAAELGAQGGLPDVRASEMLAEVFGRAMAGMCQGATAKARAALAIDHSSFNVISGAQVMALCGDRSALPLVQDLLKKRPADTVVRDIGVPSITALVALEQHRPLDAINALEPSLPYDFAGQAAYLRGLAYLQLNDPGHATPEFQKTLHWKGAALNNGAEDYAQAQLGLARAYRMAANKDAAKKAYQDFFTTWKDADPDIPMLVEAKKEFATL